MQISDTELNRAIAEIRGMSPRTTMATKLHPGGNGFTLVEATLPPPNAIQHWQELAEWLASKGHNPSIHWIGSFWAAAVKRNEDYPTAYNDDPGRALALATCMAFGVTIERAQLLIVTMPDGSTWGVPVELIATHRAAHHSADGLPETMQFFAQYPDEIHDWAANNMRWKDVEANATRITKPAPVDYQEGWCNGDWEVRIVER